MECLYKSQHTNFQNTSIMEIIAKDGDRANPRPVLLTLEGDTEQYFKLLPDRPLGRATLVASDIPIDRESDVVMQNGGVYSFFVKVLTIYYTSFFISILL